MYELRIKDSQGQWQLADLGDYLPAMVYQANNIAELRYKYANYSMKISLPKTPNNCRIFDHVNEFDVVTDVPFKKLDCRLYAEGVNIAGSRAYIKILKINKNFDVQIIGSDPQVFELLNKWYFRKDKAIQDSGFTLPDMGFYTRTEETPKSSYIAEGVGFGALASILGKTDLRDDFKQAYAVPYVKFTTLLKKTLGEEGFGIGIVHDIPGIENIATLPTDIKMSENSLRPYLGTAEQDGMSNAGYIRWSIINNAMGYMTIEEEYRINLYYSAQFNGSVVFKANDDGSPFSGGTLSVKNLTTGEDKSMSFSSGGTANVLIEFSEKDRLEIRVENNTNPPLARVRLRMSDLKSDTGNVPINGEVSIIENMGFLAISDYITTMMQTLGLLFHYDEHENTIYLGTVDNLYKNRSKALNWSKKLHHGDKEERSFTFRDYARANTISFQEDKNAEVTDAIKFYISNSNLTETKELFKIDFEAGKNAPVVAQWSTGKESEDAAIVPLYKEEDNQISFIGSGKPRIVYIDESIQMVKDGVSFPLIRHATSDYILSNYYDKLINGLLKNINYVEAEFFLTPDDVENVNQFIPIYVDYYGAYFFVSKIKNYVAGYPTLCELVKL